MVRRVFFDAWNRLAEVRYNSTTTTIAKYSYDALGRRINKQVFNSGPLNTIAPGD